MVCIGVAFGLRLWNFIFLRFKLLSFSSAFVRSISPKTYCLTLLLSATILNASYCVILTINLFTLDLGILLCFIDYGFIPWPFVLVASYRFVLNLGIFFSQQLQYISSHIVFFLVLFPLKFGSIMFK